MSYQPQSFYKKSFEVVKVPFQKCYELFSNYLSLKKEDEPSLDFGSPDYEKQLDKIVKEALEYSKKW